MLLFYVRHGYPTYDPDCLTPLGRRQADAVAKRLALYGIDRVFASSSTRAIQTAQPTCELMRIGMTVLDWCHESRAWEEYAYPDPADQAVRWDFTTPSIRKLYASPEMRALGDNWLSHPIFAGRKTAQGEARIRRETHAFLAELGYRYDPEIRMYRAERPHNTDRVALFAHEGFGMAFLSQVLDIPRPLFCTHFGMSHSNMTVLHFDENAPEVLPRVLTLSNDSHLYREGLPTFYQNRIYF